ncbi:sigma-54-dependent Fis family transcriptional regulator [Geomonas silvestris]|uniref:Sigma-54-dependent Fis family transcriptional regulator n=1 Tax=Geomonas silvestris TaxID=2740184 RepID=A0A6V8MP92_9BACT|nr:sigma-54 dependent transcriptional regulator [Geomonas silvestris]GFO61439.1 sigma-54-dependent Fis family transcriptional regulator [Geomonas silvestris]
MTVQLEQQQVLVVDDEPGILAKVSLLLASSDIQQVITLSDSREVLPYLRENPVAVVVVDWVMPHVTGGELLQRITTDYPQIPVLVMTAMGDVDTAVSCMKEGAFDFLTKPVDPNRLVASIRKALQVSDLGNQNRLLKDYLLGDRLRFPDAFEGIVTQSKKMRSIFQYIEAIATSRLPVLIAGETGVGKELLARAVHRVSGVRGPFISLNAAGLDDFMFSDTLFGHKKGAFTGADSQRDGLISAAAGGTLFLDEIGDLNHSSQIKLLRLLQEREYYRMGSDLLLKSDARIVAASNMDFEALRTAGTFRNDLYFRLCAHEFRVPPLRERLEDLEPLVQYFVASFALQQGKPVPAVSPNLIPALSQCSFPGNVRELYNMVHHAVTCNEGGVLDIGDFPGLKPAPARSIQITPGENPLISLFGRFPTVVQVEEYLIAEAMRLTGGNQTAAAEMLGLARPTLNKRLKHDRQ